jgi:UDP-N-acetylglucosamine 2-epimerase
MRNETEWVETVEAGWNLVAGTDTKQIVKAARSLIESPPDARPDLYGTGEASQRIVEILIDRYSGN